MKKIIYIMLSASIVLFGFTACEIDNYDAPAENINGTLLDATTGKPLQLEQGVANTRIKLEEISFSENPVPQYLAVKQDGTYNNDRLCKGKYRITPTDGPFIPVVIIGSTGETLVNGSKIEDVSNETTVDFNLEPFLRIEYIGEPVLSADKKITVKFKFTKGTNSQYFKIPAFLDCQLFMSNTPYVGDKNYNGLVVGGVITSYGGKSGDNLVGQEIIMTTKELKSGYKYYMRVGARVNDSFKKYNYSEIKEITVP